jgi:hypothetical protein
MYKKSGNILTNRLDLSNYVEGFDLYNSTLILKLTDSELPRENYIISNYEFRPDLIAKDIYGSTKYMGILLITQAAGLEAYTKGTVLSIIPKDIVDKIIGNI